MADAPVASGHEGHSPPYALEDRGVIATGMKSDISVIDLEHLELERSELAHDRPADGRRLIQRERGYSATIVPGEVSFVDSEPTGAMPGRLVRGADSLGA